MFRQVSRVAAICIAALILEGIILVVQGEFVRLHFLGIGVAIGCLEGLAADFRLRISGIQSNELAPIRRGLGVVALLLLVCIAALLWQQWHMPPAAGRLCWLKVMAGIVVGLWLTFRILRPPPRRRRPRRSLVLTELQQRLVDFVNGGSPHPVR